MDPSNSSSWFVFKAFAVSGAVFWLLFMALIFLAPSDPQLPIVIALSPLYAMMFGAGFGLAAIGFRGARESRPQNRWAKLAVSALSTLPLAVFCLFLLAELVQQLLPAWLRDR